MSQSAFLGQTSGAGLGAPMAGWSGAVGNRLAALPLLAWVLLAAAGMAALGIVLNFETLWLDYGDPDDALRMVQVRDFMASGRWFDTTLPRLGGDQGMLSHWSRLIDLPLALLISLFSLFLPVASAELWVRLVWPFLLLAPMLYVAVRAVEITAGRTSAMLTLVLLIASPSALIQFTAGRIDHHNVQNLGATGAVLLLWVAWRAPLAGTWAGVLAGLAIAIGYEALPLVAITTLVASLWALIDRSAAEGVRNHVRALAATAAVLFLATTAPAQWTTVYCDALSLNVVLLLCSGALGMSAVLGRARGWRTASRWALALAGGAVGAILFAVSEPQCLAGPLGQVPQGLQGTWLVNVAEAKSWLAFRDVSPPGAISIVALFALALASQAALLRRQATAADIFYLVMLLAAVLLAFWQIKYMPYASILAIAPIARMIAGLAGSASVSQATVRFAAVAVVNQWTLIIVAAIAAPVLLGGSGKVEASSKEPAKICYQKGNLADLAALPAGMVFAPIDLGAHLLADTQHSVLAAPYHRIGPAILETHAILSARSAHEAEASLRRIGARHVVMCSGFVRLVTPVGDHPDTFHARLKRGEALPFLQPVPMPAGSPFQVWRVTPAGG